MKSIKKYRYAISEATGITSLRAAICNVVIVHSVLVFDVEATDLEIQKKKTYYMKPEKNIKRLLLAILNSEDSDIKIKVCLVINFSLLSYFWLYHIS